MKKPTPRQKKLIEGLIENATGKNGTKSLKKVAIEAGYTPKSARNPQLLIDKSPIVRESVEKAIEKFKKIRDQALTLAAKKAPKASYASLINAADVMQKHANLLGGKATENVAINIQISEAVAEKNQ